MAIPFIGREDELAELARLVERGDAVRVVGEPGIGKTALVDAHANRAGARASVTIVQSRELVASWTGAVLRLRGLPRDAARELWRALDEEQGVVTGFTAAFRRSGGNPQRVIDLHAGRVGDRQASEVIAALDPDERRAALALALAGMEVHVIERDPLGLPIARLVDRLIAEPGGVGFVRLGQRWIDAILVAATAEERGAAEASARELTGATLERLAGASRRMFDEGATHLERRLASLPFEARDHRLRAERVRILIEVLALGRARSLVLTLPDDAATCLLRARVELHCGRLDDAARAIKGLDEVQAAPVAAWLAALGQGEIDERALALVAEPARERHRAWIAWWCGRDDVAGTAAREARFAVPSDGGAALGLSLLLAMLDARHGRLSSARSHLLGARDRIDAGEHPRWHALLRLASAVVDEELGARLAALAELSDLEQLLDRAGELPLSLMVGLEAARLANALGRRRAAMATLDAAERTAARLGLDIRAARARVLAADLVRNLWRLRREQPSEEHRGRALRWRVVRALQWAVSGKEREARELLTGMPPAEGPDFAVERMIAAFARATLARLARDEDLSRRCFTEAMREAAFAGVDNEVSAALNALLSRDLVVTARARRLSFGTTEPDAAVVVDASRDEVRYPGGMVALDHRPLLARLLYTLAAAPGRIFDKDELALVLWRVEYNPLRHDNTLKANVHRLNRLVGPTGLVVSFQDVGYRLTVPAQFLYIDHRESRTPREN